MRAGIVTASAPAETSVERYPAGYAPDGTRRAVIYCHGSGGNAWEPDTSSNLPSFVRQFQAITLAGFPLLSCDNGLVGGSGITSSESWGNDNAISRVADAVASAQSLTGMGAKSDKVVLMGGSMGGCVAAAYARANPGKVAGLLLLRPVSSLQDFGTRNGFAGINAAYGGTYSDSTHGPTHSAVQFAGQLTGFPVVIYAASDDAVVAYSTVQTVATASGATLTDIAPGGHTDTADARIPAGALAAFVRSVA